MSGKGQNGTRIKGALVGLIPNALIMIISLGALFEDEKWTCLDCKRARLEPQ